MYFTDCGVYFRQRSDPTGNVESEAPARAPFQPWLDALYYQTMVEDYTNRTLTYSEDILRAFSGLLYGMYGPRTTFGMPWHDFDRALLWTEELHEDGLRAHTEHDVFPTWSWSSIEGPIYYQQAITDRNIWSLALFAQVSSPDGSLPIQINIASPGEADIALFNSEEHRISRANFTTERDTKIHDVPIVAALAWLHGCIRGDVPVDIRLNCPLRDYLERLCKKWPNISNFWHDAFRDVEMNKLFTVSDVELANHAGRLMIHSQTTHIFVDWLQEDDHARNACLLRGSDGRIAGSIWLSRLYAEHMRKFDMHDVRFIALSISEGTTIEDDKGPTVPVISHTILDHTDHLSTKKTYGCPCSDLTTSNASQQQVHIPPCPEHSAFAAVPPSLYNLPLQQHQYYKQTGEERAKALVRHLQEVSYFDVEGQLLHPLVDPPALNVMMVLPSMKGSEGVFCRAGIGRVYLKKWVEANPQFGTVVVE
jgi:hypothetical protein